MHIKKKVLLVINSDLIRAGVPNVVMTLVRNLSERFVFDVITYHKQEGQYDAEFESYGGKIFRLSLLDYGKHKVLYPFRYTQIKRFLKQILSEKQYDVMHCHNGTEAGIFLKYAKRRGIPVRLAHAHGTYLRKGNNKILLWYYAYCKKCIERYATTALACSTQAGESLFLSKKFMNVLNPVDISSYRGLEKKAHAGCNLLQIGYYCQNKNQLFSIQLLKALLEEKMDVKLTFIGFSQEEAYYAQMLKTMDALSIHEHICFLPSDADKAHVFSETDIVLLPSFTEGLPLVALEAQSAHVAVILSDRISADANLGLATYAKYNSLPAWTNAVKQIYLEKECCDKINVATEAIEANEWCNRIGEIYDGQ